jgi:hypothetical protein
MNDREKRAALARNLAEFQEWQNKAAARGWKLPGNSPLPNHSWISYWKACEAYEQDPTRGRPVVPHRSGGATYSAPGEKK